MSKLHKQLKKAIKRKNIGDVMLLIRRGAPLGGKEECNQTWLTSGQPYWETPIQWALESSSLPILETLLKETDGALLNTAIFIQPGKNQNVITPLYWAVLHRKYNIARLLLSYADENTTFDIGGEVRNNYRRMKQQYIAPYQLAEMQGNTELAQEILSTMKRLQQKRLTHFNKQAEKTSDKITEIDLEINRIHAGDNKPTRHNKKFGP